MPYRKTWKRKYRLRRAAAWCTQCQWSYDSDRDSEDAVNQASRRALQHAEWHQHKVQVLIEREYGH